MRDLTDEKLTAYALGELDETERDAVEAALADGKSLLPAGVIEVRGDFQRGDAVMERIWQVAVEETRAFLEWPG